MMVQPTAEHLDEGMLFSLLCVSSVTLYAHGGLLCPLWTLKINLNAVNLKKPEATAVRTVWLQLL